MAANFMTFADVVEREDYDLWVGDEGWDLDYYLHENPELKRAPYAFITDFIGMLPMREDPASVEFKRAWEKNAENIDHLRLHPDVRDLSLLVGDEEDVPRPGVRSRPAQHARMGARALRLLGLHRTTSTRPTYRGQGGAAPRARLPGGRARDPRLGGRARTVGRNLLRKCAEAFALVAHKVPETRMILVAGPAARPRGAAARAPLDVRPFVPQLFRHHAAAHLAIVQGGLTTTMELAAFQTPFLYFPLRNHFEQQFPRGPPARPPGRRRPHGLRPHRREELGVAILDRLGKPVQYRDAPTGGTERAARMIANLL